MQALPRSSISRWPIRGSLSSAPLSSPRAAFVCASCQLSMQHRQTRGPSQRQRRRYASTAPLREQTRSGTSPATTTTTTTAPLPPAPPPSSGYARLRTRRLISISGADAPHFLQGLVTTSIEGATAAAGRRTARTAIPWSYCGFLNALGRVLHDVFIYPAPSPRPDGGGGGGDPHFVIEVDAAQLKTLLKHLKRYKLRSKIALRAVDEDEMSVWQVWNDDDHDGNGYDYGLARHDGDGDGDGRAVILRDPRAPGMGYRVLAAGADLDAQAAAGSPLGELLRLRPEGVDEGAYRVRRYLRGVAEGGAEIVPAQALPQESNLDAMGGIDFRKGCYVGQELTIRTRHRGVVRKRVLPCVLYGPDDPIPTSLEYRPDAAAAAATALATIGGGGGVGGDMRGLTIGRLSKRGRSTGTFLAGVGNIGLALCRVQLMSDLVVPNDTAALEFDPTAEFVIQPSKSEDGEAAAAAVGSVGKETVKVKAFVPDWLRRRLDEDTIKHHQQ